MPRAYQRPAPECAPAAPMQEHYARSCPACGANCWPTESSDPTLRSCGAPADMSRSQMCCNCHRLVGYRQVCTFQLAAASKDVGHGRAHRKHMGRAICPPELEHPTSQIRVRKLCWPPCTEAPSGVRSLQSVCCHYAPALLRGRLAMGQSHNDWTARQCDLDAHPASDFRAVVLHWSACTANMIVTADAPE